MILYLGEWQSEIQRLDYADPRKMPQDHSLQKLISKVSSFTPHAAPRALYIGLSRPSFPHKFTYIQHPASYHRYGVPAHSIRSRRCPFNISQHLCNTFDLLIL
ncbi:GQ67_04951T0 [Komagataella phaffii]|nr:GQ67_04951T0 [Komagataella phaffii]AOA70257.1 GQ68_04932T0 [Komagataella phaffii GS115]